MHQLQFSIWDGGWLPCSIIEVGDQLCEVVQRGALDLVGLYLTQLKMYFLWVMTNLVKFSADLTAQL